MKLPGLLALGRTFAKAPDHAPALLEAALPGLRVARSARNGQSTRGAAAPAILYATALAPRSAPPTQLQGTARSVVGPERGETHPSKTGENGTFPAAAAGPEPELAAVRVGRGWWWGRRRRHPRQTQLLLASVRVVRNDLLADDLELLPRPSPAARGLKLGVERAVPSGGWRGWLAHWAHLLGLRRERHP